MTIFNSIPTCEICQDAEPEKKSNGTYKPRCKRCGERYDAQGVAFILYCDFHRFTNKGRGYITFWVSDDHVQKSPVPYGHLVGVHIDELYAQMEDIGRYPISVEKSILE